MMRSAHDSQNIPTLLKQYAWEYFREAEHTKDDLREMSVFFVDRFYRVMAKDLDSFDEYVRAYVSTVLPFIWDTLQNRGVDVFYLVDNNFEVQNGDQRFSVIKELFEYSGFAVVTPYTDKNELRNFEDIEKQLRGYLNPVRMIMYIEKDSREAYMNDVVKLALTTDYVCVGRSEPADKSEVAILGGVNK